MTEQALEKARLALLAAGEKGLTSKELAEASGVSRDYLTSSVIIALTWYCPVYGEREHGTTRYWIDEEVDQWFNRKLPGGDYAVERV